MQIEPRPHVYVAGLAPVKPRMGKHDLSAADQQREKHQRGNPMGCAHERGVPLALPGRPHARHDHGWSRYLHFQAAWLAVGTGLFYVLYGVFAGHFRRNLFPAAADLSIKELGGSLVRHLAF